MSKQINIDSICSLHNELVKASSSKSYDFLWLRKKCNKQGQLALTERKSLNIIPMSLNTFESYANKHIDGGFETIDKLRLKLHSQRKKYHKRKKERVSEINTDLKDKLEEAIRSRAIMIKAYNELNRIALDAIAHNRTYERDYKKHIDLYKGFFGLKAVSRNND